MSPEADISFSLEDFENALNEYDYTFQNGQRVRGTIASHSNEGVYVDVGGKAAAFLPLREAALRPVADLEAALPVGEERDFLVVRDQNADGQVTLSIRRLELQKVWAQLQEQLDSQTTLTVKVTGNNRGGLMVDVEGLRGFIPRSQLNNKESLEGRKGETLNTILIEVTPERNRVVLSERKASQNARFAQLALGQLVEGQVVNLKPYGVFVEFDSSIGLLHINQVSQKRISALDEFFSVGQTVRALIVALDEGRGRISLSTKLLENFPGEVMENLADVIETAEARAERARIKLEQEGAI